MLKRTNILVFLGLHKMEVQSNVEGKINLLAALKTDSRLVGLLISFDAKSVLECSNHLEAICVTESSPVERLSFPNVTLAF